MTQGSTVRLRPAGPDDAATVAEIWRAGWREAHIGNVPDALVAARTDESFRIRAMESVAKTTVAMVGAELAGFVMVAGDEVEQLYVSARHRGAGVADALMGHAEGQIRVAGHRTAWLAVVPGNDSGFDRHVRLSFATSMANIDKGIDRIAEFLKKLS